MRRFGLITGSGKEIDITSDKIFFYQPDGLGYEENLSYRRIGHQYSLLDRYQEQGEISGNIIFMGKKPYSQFKTFVYDTYRSGLILTYTTDEGSTVYKRNVVISSLQKTELNLGGYLDCPITFKASTPWYLEVAYNSVPVRITGNNGWKWETNTTWANGTGPHAGSIPFKSTVDMEVEFSVSTQMISPCALVIEGPISKPRWEHVVGSKVYADGGMECNIANHEFLVVDSRSIPYSIKVYGEAIEDGVYIGKPDYDNVLRNVYSYSDFSTDRFIQLRRGRNKVRVYSLLTLERSLTIGVEANIYHAAV